MKKIISILAAGVMALSLASSVDAATSIRLGGESKGTTVVKETNSSLYNMSIRTEQGSAVQIFNYIYSPNIVFSQELLNYLSSNNANLNNLLPSVANEIAVAYFKAMSSGDRIQLFNGSGQYEYTGWAYGGVDGLNIDTIDYWDDIVNVANNTSIVPGRSLSIKTPQGIQLATYGSQFDLDHNIIVRNESAISKFYNDNKTTFSSETSEVEVSYGYVDGVLTKITNEVINRESVDIYNLSIVKSISPIVLDITGKGVLEASNGQYMPHKSVDLKNTIVTDFYGDGFEIAMEWVGANDGLLVAPKADGTVDMSCLFGTAGGYETGYEKLSLYADKDGVVRGDNLNKLAVWQDANRNGKADAGEVKSCNSLGITSINTNHKAFVSSFEMNGKTQKMWDWWPSAAELHKVASK